MKTLLTTIRAAALAALWLLTPTVLMAQHESVGGRGGGA